MAAGESDLSEFFLLQPTPGLPLPRPAADKRQRQCPLTHAHRLIVIGVEFDICSGARCLEALKYESACKLGKSKTKQIKNKHAAKN